MPIELTRSYGKRTRDDNVAEVQVVSDTTIRYRATFIDLRRGVESGSTRNIDLAYARDGRILRRVGQEMHVVHPDGRSVPMKLEDIGLHDPTFVGNALVVQDDRNRAKAFGVFDTATGALRGRIEHTVDPRAPQVVGAIPRDGKDGRHVWFSDVTSLRSWDVETLRCDVKVNVPPGHHVHGVSITRAGNLVTSMRPIGGNSATDEIVVFARSGDAVARRPQRHMSIAIAGQFIAVTDTAMNRIVFFDEKLEEHATVALPPKEDFAQLVELWSGLDEVLAIDGHFQVHHVADPSLRPTDAAESAAKAPAKPSAKKPAKKPSKR